MAEPLETLDSLSSSLDEIEILLGPLFQKSLSQTEEKLEPLQKAKLDVLLTYVIQDLVLSAFEPTEPGVFLRNLFNCSFLENEGPRPFKTPCQRGT
jgi:hypothetical protein